MRHISWFTVGALFASACVITPPTPPPARMFELGSNRTSYRDFREATDSTICDSEPRWLVDELTNVNGVLSRFLKTTDPSQARTWTPEQRSLAIEGRAELPAFVEIHVSNLRALKNCSIANWQSLPMLRERGLELSAAVTERLPQISQVLEYVDAQVVLESWQDDFAKRRQDAQSTGCTSRDSDRIYYAESSPDGSETRWFFCDGARVTRKVGGEPDFSPPDRRGRVRSSDYVRQAREFPEDQVVASPALPPIPAALADERAAK